MRIIRPDGAPSWSISTSESLGLAVLLYIRDGLQIPHTAALVFPSVTPTVPAAQTAPSRRLTEQWNQRWIDATGPGGNTDIGLESPTSQSFDDTPDLRTAYQQHLEAAARWFAPSRRDHVDHFRAERARGQHNRAGELVTAWQETTGLEPAPFTLTIRFVPVEGRRTWQTGPLEYVVAQSLARETEEFVGWVGPIVARAAAGDSA
ncbi:MAG: hypothetical protein U5O16_00075 [Rhodococcus sp. (in: high G+C Gram-positive bacteria)]|uniref:hypothetical protein n=1 Tax=Rhodococcus sp. TaxID=1831 RepID=UPI002AD83969|nr:hypothetical protein [Rhodococcus sp. (in: high G+C Gram-positive bacteria)]